MNRSSGETDFSLAPGMTNMDTGNDEPGLPAAIRCILLMILHF